MNPVIAMVLFGNAGTSLNTAQRFSRRWLMCWRPAILSLVVKVS